MKNKQKDQISIYFFLVGYSCKRLLNQQAVATIYIKTLQVTAFPVVIKECDDQSCAALHLRLDHKTKNTENFV